MTNKGGRLHYVIIQHFIGYQLLSIVLNHQGNLGEGRSLEDRRRIMSQGGGKSAASAGEYCSRVSTGRGVPQEEANARSKPC